MSNLSHKSSVCPFILTRTDYQITALNHTRLESVYVRRILYFTVAFFVYKIISCFIEINETIVVAKFEKMSVNLMIKLDNPLCRASSCSLNSWIKTFTQQACIVAFGKL